MRKNNGFLDETMNKILKYYKFTSVKKFCKGNGVTELAKNRIPLSVSTELEQLMWDIPTKHGYN